MKYWSKLGAFWGGIWGPAVQAIKHYTERIQQADAVGQIGLRVQLEGPLADETDHAEAIARLLGK